MRRLLAGCGTRHGPPSPTLRWHREHGTAACTSLAMSGPTSDEIAARAALAGDACAAPASPGARHATL
jgi:hypothetical protein